ncbi:MAG TPA: HtaA domain-containing protein, partial [Phototrophicaceae bacterium]|nr:HtaA domain-containing protein [Phototrophicaceae bacterium]
MKTITWRARARRTLAVLTTTALAGGLVTVGTAASAAADEPAREVVSGSAQWGVKSSLRDYVGSPFAHGTIAADDGASRREDGTFELTATGGRVAGTTAEVDLAGRVAFTAHDGALDIAFANPRILIDGADGSLVVDAVSREFAGPGGELGEPVSYPGVVLGAIDLSANPLTVTDGVAEVSGAPVTLTEAGAPAFGGFYDAGAELDPISFSVELAPATAAPQVTVQPQDVTVDEGDDAVFSAAASGTPEPTVQWQTRGAADGEWTDVAGATGTDLTLPAVGPEQDGTQVRAVFRNGTEPDATTEAATLTVVPAEVSPVFEPAVEVFAADGVTPVGDAPVTFGDTVVVRGTGFDPAANVGGRGV